MKKLKKSLLVVPALGVLMLAAAGSVGGTVAWFSSVNKFETDVSSFSVGRVEGNLDVEMEAKTAYGTIQVGKSVAVGKVAAGDVMMTHGSFNHANAIGNTSVYTISSQAISEVTTGDGEKSTFVTPTRTGLSVDRTQFLLKSQQVGGTYIFTYSESKWTPSGKASGDPMTQAELATTWGIAYAGTPADGKNKLVFNLRNTYVADADWMYGNDTSALDDGKYWYHAVSWDMTFSYNFGTDSTTRNVYFDMDSAIRVTSDQTTNTHESWKGFRLAFHNYNSTTPSLSRSVIWAPQQTKANIHYVAAAGTEVSDYSDSANVGLLYSGIDSDEILANSETSGGTADASSNKNYLCQLTSGKNSVTINCVAWFEGSDPNVINQARLDTVAATLKFFAASDNTPTP